MGKKSVNCLFKTTEATSSFSVSEMEPVIYGGYGYFEVWMRMRVRVRGKDGDGWCCFLHHTDPSAQTPE